MLEIDINNFDIADQFKVNARAYLIPEAKRLGKFEKFGFYCAKCDAYMTGQIQLVMVMLNFLGLRLFGTYSFVLNKIV